MLLESFVGVANAISYTYLFSASCCASIMFFCDSVVGCIILCQQHSFVCAIAESRLCRFMSVKLKKGQQASAYPSPIPTRASGAAASSSTLTAFAAKLPKPPSTGNASLDTRLNAHRMHAQKAISSMQSEW